MADVGSNLEDTWSGFRSGFTWQNVGFQLANGLIAGAAGWGIRRLLNELFNNENNLNVQKMFQYYADDIVNRVTKNIRHEIQSAFSKEIMRSLNAQTIMLNNYYQLYVDTAEDRYIDAAEQRAIEAAAEAQTLGLVGLGIFQVISGMKMSVFSERGFVQPLISEIERATMHVRELQEEALWGAEKGVTQARVVNWHGKDYGNRVMETYRFQIDGEPHEVSLSPPGRDSSPISDYRNKIIGERLKFVSEGIVDPSGAVVEKWEECRNKLIATAQQERMQCMDDCGDDGVVCG